MFVDVPLEVQLVGSPANRMVDGREEWSRSLGDGGIGDATGTVPFDWKGLNAEFHKWARTAIRQN